MSDWYAYIDCKKCGRKQSKFFTGKTNKEITIGCNECGQSTNTILKTQTIDGPNIKITISVPCYDS